MKNKFYTPLTWLVAIALLAAPQVTWGQKSKSKNPAPAPATNQAPPAAKEADKAKTIPDITKGSRAIPGLFTLYQDTVTGAVRMVVSEAQLNQEFILFSHVANGVVDANSFKGSYRGTTIFTIRKYFDKIEFVEENTGMYFDPANALSKAADANVSKSVMLSEKIEASDKGEKKYLIKCDALFLKETLGQVKPPRFPNAPPTAFALGNLDQNKTKVVAIKNYPENSDVLVEFVYSQDAPLNGGGAGVTDARNISIRIQNSFVRLPQNDYQPRWDDPRVGFFTQQINDMTSASTTPYRDMINRWYLKKKDPNAALSEPEQPIVWWIENTTPVEFRETIKEAVLQWNNAFEKAGFKNAVVVNVQPDNADWDAGDIRYNVLRWTSSPNPPFGGYGPSFVNPRTGQILGADIMLEFVYHTNRVKYDKLFHLSNSAYEEAHAAEMNTDASKYCSFGEIMQENMLFGQTVLAAAGAADLEMKEMKREAMMELIMHEVGHTMGLNHNMKSSQLYTPEQLADKDFIKGKSLVGSVMDYTAINVTRDRSKQGQYYTPALGPYDLWAIEFGYKPVKSNDELNALLARSTEPQLIFGNDADDMRSPGKAIDPRVNTGDLSNDQIRYSTDRFELVNDLMKNIKKQYSTPGQTYQEMRQAFFILNGQYDGAATIISRFVGGVYVDRAMIGQTGGTKPYTPVAYADQKRAMTALGKYVFSPDAYKVPNDLYNHLALQRRGFNFFSAPEDPKMHERVVAAQRGVLSHLLHQNTLQRIVDSQLYGNTYSLGEMMTDLTGSIFTADMAGNVNTFRQNLQVEYVKMLINISTSKDYMHAVKSMAIFTLKDLKAKLPGTGDLSTRAHRSHLTTLITNALDEVK
jgi:hypothetical protein